MEYNFTDFQMGIIVTVQVLCVIAFLVIAYTAVRK